MPFIPVYDSSILAAPNIGSASIDGSDQLVVSLTRGSTEPDFTHYNLYYSATPGIDPTNAGTYDGVIQSTDGNVIDLGPWAPPLYLVATEVAFTGDESGGSNEYEIPAGPAPETPSANCSSFLLLLFDET